MRPFPHPTPVRFQSVLTLLTIMLCFSWLYVYRYERLPFELKLKTGSFHPVSMMNREQLIGLNKRNAGEREKVGDDSSIMPLCTEGILDKRSFNYGRLGFWAMVPKDRCLLHLYTRSETFRCLDDIFPDLTNGSIRQGKRIHLAFVGDSRIRQIFFYLQKVYNIQRPWKSRKIIKLKESDSFSLVLNGSTMTVQSMRISRIPARFFPTWRCLSTGDQSSTTLWLTTSITGPMGLTIPLLTTYS